MKLSAILAAIGMVVSAVPAEMLKVGGAVAQPGALEVTERTRLRDAIQLAGGVTDDANLKRVRIVRADGIESVHDLTKLGPSPLVEPGDSIFVEPIDNSKQVVVKGAVQSPGAIDHRAGMTALDALKQAAVFENLQTESITIERLINGQRESVVIPMKEIHAEALRPGDTVVVAYQRSSFSDRDLITILAIAVLILILVKR